MPNEMKAPKPISVSSSSEDASEIDGSQKDAGMELKAFAHDECIIVSKCLEHPFRYCLIVSGTRVASFLADGCVVATPAGSTGYSSSVGGPVSFSDIDAMIITPIAPRLRKSRSLVVGPNDLIVIEAVATVSSPVGGISVVVDGRREEIAGKSFCITISYKGESLEVAIEKRL